MDLRVHLQIIEWKLLDDTVSLDPTAWVWKFVNGSLAPVPTDKDVAPPSILKVIANYLQEPMWYMFVHARRMV